MTVQKTPTSSSMRNLYAPRGDRLLVGYAVDEQTGSTLNNLGLSLEYNTFISIPHQSGVQRYNGEILDDSPSPDDSRWFNDPQEGPYLYLKSNTTGISQQYVRVLNNDSGNEIISLRGTMMMRFSIQHFDSGGNQFLFSSGGTATNGNRLTAFRDYINGDLKIGIGESTIGTNYQTRLSFDIVANKIYTIIWTWGEKGFNAWLDGVEGKLVQLPGPILEDDPDFEDSRANGGQLTNTHWSVLNGQEVRIGKNHLVRHANMNLYSFAWWDVQLKEVEREELFCDPYISFRPKAADYSGSGSNSLFRTYNNPIPVRPRLNTDLSGSDRDEITFSAVTATNMSGEVFMRVQYDTDPIMANPIISNTVSDSEPNHQLNLIVSGLAHATTYYYIAEYSVNSIDWYPFPGGRGKFKTQKRVDTNFNYVFYTDDHLGHSTYGGPPLESLNLGYGGDILHHNITNPEPDSRPDYHGHKWFMAWRSMYDLYVNQDVDFIIIGGDYYFADNGALYDGDTDNSGNTEKLAESYRNWCNILFKSGVCYFIQGNHENEAGYFQREDRGYSTPNVAQLRATIARKKFFPNPTHETYPQGGEYETPHNGEFDWIPAEGNDWIPAINTMSSTEGDNVTPGRTQVTYDQQYRDVFILGSTIEDPYFSSVDPHQLNRSPLENYFGWTWGNTLFVAIDVYRYTEPGDPLNTGGNHNRSGPVWRIGEVQKTWIHQTLANSNEKYKFVLAHNLAGGEAITPNGVTSTDHFINGWYGRGSGALIKRSIGVEGVNAYDDGVDSDNDGISVQEESADEIELHNLMKQYHVTAFVKGHDHKFCHVVNEEVNYISVSSPSAPGQWERTGMRNSYGHTEDQNNPIPAAAALGIKVTSNTRGYCVFKYNNIWECVSRICSLTPDSTSALVDSEFSDARFGGRDNRAGPGWAGPIYTPDSSDQITLSETPWQIYTICSLSDGVFTDTGTSIDAGIWTESGGVNDTANLYIPQDDVWEEFYGNNVITLNSSIVDSYSSNSLHVMHVPQDDHTLTILNAVDEDQNPVNIHNINSDDVIFVYNINVDGSEEVAQYYREKRNIPASNLVGLDMPVPTPPASCEAPISKAVFEATILEPLRSIITAPSDSQLGASGTGFSCSVIVLGYGTPLSYIEDDGEVIAIASRLHRLHYDYEAKRPNHTYDRREFKFYDVEDSQQICITAIIDGPTVAAAKKLIDRGVTVTNQPVITGSIVIDPYGLRITSDHTDYEEDILDFVNNYAPNLGSTINTTVEIDSENPYVEPTVAVLSGESFYWGWFESTFSKDLFLNQNQKRVFLYNADYDSACQIHYYQNSSPFQPDGSDPWCNLAINIEPGYAACAGSVDEPGADAFLRPRPFFSALQQGATIGEAFLFSSPYVNWKTVLIGDPLTTVIFPADIPVNEDPNNTTIPNNEVIRRIKESIEEALGWGARQARMTTWLREFNVESYNLGEEIRLLYNTAKWETRRNIQVFNNLLSRSTQGLLSYILATTGLTFSQWLSRESEKVSILMNNLLMQLGTGAISDDDTDDLVYTEGHWDYEFVYTHNRQTFENLNFELQLSVDKNFTEIVIDLATASSVSGWQYEAEPYQFVQLASSGFPSNFSGRRLKFTTPVIPATYLLTRTDVFYVRWRAMEEDGVTPVTDWNVASKLLIVKR